MAELVFYYAFTSPHSWGKLADLAIGWCKILPATPGYTRAL